MKNKKTKPVVCQFCKSNCLAQSKDDFDLFRNTAVELGFRLSKYNTYEDTTLKLPESIFYYPRCRLLGYLVKQLIEINNIKQQRLTLRTSNDEYYKEINQLQNNYDTLNNKYNKLLEKSDTRIRRLQSLLDRTRYDNELLKAPPPVETKLCSKCKQDLPLTDYKLIKKSKKLTKQCNKCLNSAKNCRKKRKEVEPVEVDNTKEILILNEKIVKYLNKNKMNIHDIVKKENPKQLGYILNFYNKLKSKRNNFCHPTFCNPIKNNKDLIDKLLNSNFL